MKTTEKSYLIRVRYPTNEECHRYIDWFQISAKTVESALKKAKRIATEKIKFEDVTSVQ